MYSPMLFQTPEDEDQPEDGDNPTSKNAVIKELMQENSDLASLKSKAKKRKGEIIEVHGGRIIHPTDKKDRHSKVCTARGPRDRRVRLSPRTAIQFYDVQDRLGYDRPSKAIDWLIKEAKSAIDALDEPPLFAANASDNIPKHHYLTNENPFFGFGFLLDGYAASSFPTDLNRYEAQENTALHPGYQQESYSALTTWNCAGENLVGGGPPYSSINSAPVHFPSEPIFGYSQMSSQREPLQSSIINYSPINTHLSGLDFSDELSNITAAAILTDDDKDMSVFRRQFSAAPFLQYEG